MRIISSTEFRNNLKKYLDLAATDTERIVIHRGKDELFEVCLQKPDDIIWQIGLLERIKDMEKHYEEMKDELRKIHEFRGFNDSLYEDQEIRCSKWVKKVLSLQESKN